MQTSLAGIRRPFTAPARILVPTLVGVLLALHGAMLAWLAYCYSPTVDEPAHLVAGISHWKFGRFDLYRVNPPLVRLIAALPMLVIDPRVDWRGFTSAPYARPEFTLGSAFINANGPTVFWYFTLARWACIPFSVIGAYFTFRWSRDLYGTRAGIAGLVLWCFCPNILGNGALITPDVAAASLGVTACYVFRTWLVNGGWRRAVIAGVALGLAQLTKSTWIILFGVWPVVWAVWRAMDCSWRRPIYFRASTCSAAPLRDESRKTMACGKGQPQLAQLCTVLLLGLYVLNIGYGCERCCHRLDTFAFVSSTLNGLPASASPGNRFVGTPLGHMPVPLPEAFLAGIDVQVHDFERTKWSYLRGEHKRGGWWYFYLYAMGVKLPVGALVLFAAACWQGMSRLSRAARRQCSGCTTEAWPGPRFPGACIRDRRRQSAAETCAFRNAAALLIPGLAVLLLVSSQTGFSRYLRYVLPAFPFLFVWASQAATSLDPSPTPCRAVGRGDRGLCLRKTASLPGVAVVLALAMSVTSSLAVFPHSLSYFNELVGGPANGPAHLLDANIDWGQDLFYLKEWCRSHPNARPLRVVCSGCDPKLAGISSEPPPRLPAESTSDGHPHPGATAAGGWYAISVNELYGYDRIGYGRDEYGWLRRRSPVARAGYSFYLMTLGPAPRSGDPRTGS